MPSSVPTPLEPQQNHLLAALSLAERERLFPHLQLVPLPLGKVLYESGDVMRHVYFPTDSIVSLLYVLEDGTSAEISVVGNEGLVGVALFMGGETTPSRAIVQSAGYAYRLIGRLLKEEFHRSGGMQLLLLRYTQALLTQMAQTAVCNRHHCRGPAAVSLAAAVSRSPVLQHVDHDPGAHRQHAGRAP
jgi:CRP-like cAMP-binding protein